MPRHQTTDGSVVHYRLQGRALAGRPALIFIHGWCGNLHHWDAQARHFSRTHRVLRVDRRGHGRSQVFEDPGTGRDHADDIAAIAQRERIRKAVVVGSGGDGCPIALELTRSHPNLVRGTVLIDTPLNPQVTIGAGNHALGAILGEMSDCIRTSGARANRPRLSPCHRPDNGCGNQHSGYVGREIRRSSLGLECWCKL